MVRVAVVVADGVESGGVRLALDAHVIERIQLVTISRTVDDGVPGPLGVGRPHLAGRADQDAADLIRITLRRMRSKGVVGRARDLHLDLTLISCSLRSLAVEAGGQVAIS